MSFIRNIKAWLLLRFYSTDELYNAYEFLGRTNPDNANLLSEKHRAEWVIMRELNRRGASINRFYGA